MAWTPGDLSVLVHSTIWVLFAIASAALGLRIYSRAQKVGVGLQGDDWVLLAGWGFVLLASGAMSWLMAIFLIRGSSKKITIARVHHNLQTIALGLTKTSFGMTLLRLMPGGWESKLIYGLIITMNLQFIVHIFASWQQICGAPDDGHLGSKCWALHQSVTFTVFSAVYSALCDFILALLPWKMIFNLQMKRSERLGIAIALSMGVIAGITGVMKAYTGYKLIDVRNPDYLYNQAVYWVWSMAEPNVTIISASIPVLRGFVRNARIRTQSNPTGGGYIKTGESNSKFYNAGTVTAVRSEIKDHDADSDRSILGRGPQDAENGGITWTHEVSVEYEARPETSGGTGIAITKDNTSREDFEMATMAPRPGPADGART
ncbi:hypothetical protein ACHAQA_005535 [Verticillium albo-atrum]